MRIGTADTNTSIALVAEVGNNHEGSTSLARELVDAAFESGASAVKLQTFVPELYVTSADPKRLEILREFRLPEDFVLSLIEENAREGRTVFSTPFDLESAKMLADADVLKVSSGDISFEQLIEQCARLGKALILSSGASHLDEVRRAVHIVTRTWASKGIASDLAILHCVSAYPASPSAANLRSIATLQSIFPQATIGFSDHTLGIETAVLAAAVGARIIERHFTLDRQQSSFRDHALSSDPSEFRSLRIRLDEVQECLGDGVKAPHPSEAENIELIRRSLTAGRDLAAGHRLSEADVVIVRPGAGLPPGRLGEVIGRTLRREVRAGTALSWEDFA